MNDPNRKFRSTQHTLDELGSTLDAVIGELTTFLYDQMDCESCGNEDADCPDCYERDCKEEADRDV